MGFSSANRRSRRDGRRPARSAEKKVGGGGGERYHEGDMSNRANIGKLRGSSSANATDRGASNKHTCQLRRPQSRPFARLQNRNVDNPGCHRSHSPKHFFRARSNLRRETETPRKVTGQPPMICGTGTHLLSANPLSIPHQKHQISKNDSACRALMREPHAALSVSAETLGAILLPPALPALPSNTKGPALFVGVIGPSLTSISDGVDARRADANSSFGVRSSSGISGCVGVIGLR